MHLGWTHCHLLKAGIIWVRPGSHPCGTFHPHLKHSYPCCISGDCVCTDAGSFSHWSASTCAKQSRSVVKPPASCNDLPSVSCCSWTSLLPRMEIISFPGKSPSGCVHCQWQAHNLISPYLQGPRAVLQCNGGLGDSITPTWGRVR